MKPLHFYKIGPFLLNAEERLLFRDSERVDLSPKALEILVFLIERQSRLVTREELIQALWPDTFVEDGNLTFNISVLRKALGDDRQNGNRFIETVPKRGYRFVAPVTKLEPDFGEAGTSQSSIGHLPVRGSNSRSSHAHPEPTVAAQAPAESRPERADLTSKTRTWLGIATILAIGLAGYAFIRPLPSPTAGSPQQLTNDGEGKGTLATDGLRLYFPEGNYPTVLKTLSVTGGESTTIPTGLRDFSVLDISPDRGSLMLGESLGSTFSLWRQPLPAGSAERIGDVAGREASWSPDGRRIAYSGGSDLFVANSDGTAPRRLASMPDKVWGIRWSPDGQRVRFTVESSDRNGTTNSLWEVSAESGTPRRVLPLAWNDPAEECCGSWTPDGKYFIFQSQKGGKENIWARREKGAGVHLGGRNPIRLTDLLQDCFRPILSPNGQRVFFIAVNRRGSLERFSAPEKHFVSFLGGMSAQWVSVSPDRNWIAYVTFPQGILWRMRADTTERRQLTFPPTKVNGLAWSPDGRQIVFNAWTSRYRYKNYVVPASGDQEPKELLPDRHELEGIATWSPDGGRIAFGDVPRIFGVGTKENVIHVLNLASNKLETLQGSEGLWTARWSPDGRYIAAIRDDDPDRYSQRLFLYDCKSRRWQALKAAHVDDLTWSHDSKYIYYDGEAGYDGIFRVRIPDGKAEQVALIGRMGRLRLGWSGLTPDDEPLILRDVGTQEIYALDVDWP